MSKKKYNANIYILALFANVKYTSKSLNYPMGKLRLVKELL